MNTTSVTSLFRIEGVDYLIKGVLYLSKGAYYFAMLPINMMGINLPAYFLQMLYLFVLGLILYRLTNNTLATLIIMVLLVSLGIIGSV